MVNPPIPLRQGGNWGLQPFNLFGFRQSSRHKSPVKEITFSRNDDHRNILRKCAPNEIQVF